MEDGKLHGLTLVIDQSDSIVRLMDTGVILMEGGTEHDLLTLDQVDRENCTTDGNIPFPICYNIYILEKPSTEDSSLQNQEVL